MVPALSPYLEEVYTMSTLSWWSHLLSLHYTIITSFRRPSTIISSNASHGSCPAYLLRWCVRAAIDRTYITGLVQDCSNSSVLAMELLQSCTKPSIWSLHINTLRPLQSGRYFAEDIFTLISLMKSLAFLIECPWNLLPRVQLIIRQYWYR